MRREGARRRQRRRDRDGFPPARLGAFSSGRRLDQPPALRPRAGPSDRSTSRRTARRAQCARRVRGLAGSRRLLSRCPPAPGIGAARALEFFPALSCEVDPAFFRTMRIPLLKGREFTTFDEYQAVSSRPASASMWETSSQERCVSIRRASPAPRESCPYAPPAGCLPPPLARRRPLDRRPPTREDPTSSSIAGRRCQRLPSSLAIESASASASGCVSSLSRRGTSDER